jgi:hypothetical protein
MQFTEEWITEINEGRKDEDNFTLVVTYKNGFAGSDEFYNNKMTDWKVISAKGDTLEI